MQKLRAYLQLLRFPAVFTAMSDIFLGYLIANQNGFDPIAPFLLLLGSSSCLYLSGMAFNDFFDRREDAVKRPGRPIPSSRVKATHALLISVALMTVGLVLASIAGSWSLLVACLISTAILVYDALFKNTLAGPLLMGSCRLLNVLLGASMAAEWKEVETGPAIALGVYIVGVTLFARREEETSDRKTLINGALVMDAGLALMALYPLFWRITSSRIHDVAAILIAVVAIGLNRSLIRAIQVPSPQSVQSAVKQSLLAIILLDAILILGRTGRVDHALITAALLIPSYFIAKWVYVT